MDKLLYTDEISKLVKDAMLTEILELGRNENIGPICMIDRIRGMALLYDAVLRALEGPGDPDEADNS